MSRLALAQAFLDDAKLCLNNGRYRSAASRAYYVVFHASIALFEHLGYVPANFRGRDGWPARRWEHGIVVTDFHIEFVHKRHLFPWRRGAEIRTLYSSRIDADYKPDRPILQLQATERVRQASEIVGQIEKAMSHEQNDSDGES